MLLEVTLIAIICITLSVDAWTITNWYTSTSFPDAQMGSFSAYDEVTNSVWMIGGRTCSTCVFSYNLTSNTITSRTNVSNGGNNWSKNTVIIDQVLYYYTYDDGLSTYDIKTQTENYLIATPPTTISEPCVATNREGSQIYLVGGEHSTVFYIYNVSDNVWITGPNIANSRQFPTCEVSNNNYLYLFGGNSDDIEKISLDLLNQWNTITNNVTPGNIYCYGIISSVIDNIIYLVGGYYVRTYDEMFYLNTNDDSIELGSIYMYRAYTNGIIINNIMYVIGGLNGTGSSAIATQITYTNQLAGTDAPTKPPTEAPTSNPSDSPTDSPTDIPTDAPTNAPANSPTVSPTVSPTDAPTNTPSDIPTDTPTDIPTDAPTDIPTDAPTASPTNTPTDTPTDIPTDAPTASPSTDNIQSLENNNADNDSTYNISETVLVVIIVASCFIVICCSLVCGIISYTYIKRKYPKSPERQNIQNELGNINVANNGVYNHNKNNDNKISNNVHDGNMEIVEDKAFNISYVNVNVKTDGIGEDNVTTRVDEDEFSKTGSEINDTHPTEGEHLDENIKLYED